MFNYGAIFANLNKAYLSPHYEYPIIQTITLYLPKGTYLDSKGDVIDTETQKWIETKNETD